MTSRDFCFWLQGYMEITNVDERPALSTKQVEVVQKHLALVFKHEIDPSAGDEKHQVALNAIHEPVKSGPEANVAPPTWHVGHVDPNGLAMRC